MGVIGRQPCTTFLRIPGFEYQYRGPFFYAIDALIMGLGERFKGNSCTAGGPNKQAVRFLQTHRLGHKNRPVLRFTPKRSRAA